MAVSYSNLDQNVQGMLSRGYPDIGQVTWLVDSDYRTAAQGWSRADRTGPLDLYEARKAGPGGAQYVFRTEDYSDDTVAIQAAIDSQIDFRGDALCFTPGAYSLAAALVVDVPDARWIGPYVSHPSLARASITATVAANIGVTAAADRMEVGFLQFIPATAQTMWDIAAVSGLHVHDTFYNTDGIAASTATVGFVLATTAEFAAFERNYIWVDAAQGPWVRAAGIMKGLTIRDFQIYAEAGTWATALDLAGVGAASVDIGPGTISGTGTAAVTTLVTIANKTVDDSNGFVHGVRCSTHGPAAGALTTLTTDVATMDLTECWLAVVADAAQPTFTSGAAISWESGVPYTG